MKKIKFYYYDSNPNLRNRNKLKLFIFKLFKKERTDIVKINYIFCSDRYLLSLNRKFLKHNYYTDVITFDMSAFKNKIEAEIYISIDRVKENARLNQNSFEHEIHRVMFHGALHLCGYNDKTKGEIAKMRRRENMCLKLFFDNK